MMSNDVGSARRKEQQKNVEKEEYKKKKHIKIRKKRQDK